MQLVCARARPSDVPCSFLSISLFFSLPSFLLPCLLISTLSRDSPFSCSSPSPRVFSLDKLVAAVGNKTRLLFISDPCPCETGKMKPVEMRPSTLYGRGAFLPGRGINLICDQISTINYNDKHDKRTHWKIYLLAATTTTGMSEPSDFSKSSRILRRENRRHIHVV